MDFFGVFRICKVQPLRVNVRHGGICMHTQEKLSVDSFQSLFEALLPVDDGRGIRLGDYNKSRIPDEIKQIALDKGYQLDTFNAE